MSAEANPQLALRPMLPGEAPLLEEIFCASIVELTQDDYEVEQQEAWIAEANNGVPFSDTLAKQTTIVATMSGSPAGFASLARSSREALAERVSRLHINRCRAFCQLSNILRRNCHLARECGILDNQKSRHRSLSCVQGSINPQKRPCSQALLKRIIGCLNLPRLPRAKWTR